MKIWTSEHTFNHPWETVTQAAWRKYPNPMTPSIIGTDVIERKVIGGVLHTHRLVQSKWCFPRWTHSLFGTAKTCFASERSTVDPARRQMILKTMNLTFCRHVSIDEVLYYESDPTDANKTLMKQEASVSVQGVPLSHYMEDLLTSTISKNACKGRQGLEWVIGRINAEVKDIAESAVKGTDDLIMTTRRSIDEMAESARKNMDDINAEVKGIAESAVKGTDDLIMTTRRSIDEMAESARKNMDDINAEVKGIAESAVKGTDDLITTTRRSIDEMTESARKNMDDISAQAKKHIQF